MQRSELLCDIDDVEVPEEYQRIWNDINLPLNVAIGSHERFLDDIVEMMSIRPFR